MPQIETMTHPTSPAARQFSVFEPPEYKLRRGHDRTLEWEPPADSEELAIALSWHYPMERSLVGKMQAAIRSFLEAEPRNRPSHNISNRGPPSQPSAENVAPGPRVKGSPTRYLPIQSSVKEITGPRTRFPLETVTIPKFRAWTPDETELKPMRRKRKYDQEEAVKVAKNRGNACDEHRRLKTKCDPEKCTKNKLYPKGPKTVGKSVSSETSHASLSATIPSRSMTGSAINLGQFDGEKPVNDSDLLGGDNSTFLNGTSSFPSKATTASHFNETDAYPSTTILPESNERNLGYWPHGATSYSGFITGDVHTNGDASSPWLKDLFNFPGDAFIDDPIEALGGNPTLASPNTIFQGLPSQKDRAPTPQRPINNASSGAGESHSTGGGGGRTRRAIDGSIDVNLGQHDKNDEWGGFYSGIDISAEATSEYDSMVPFEVERFCLPDTARNRFRASRIHESQNYKAKKKYGPAKGSLPHRLAHATNKRMRGNRFGGESATSQSTLAPCWKW